MPQADTEKFLLGLKALLDTSGLSADEVFEPLAYVLADVMAQMSDRVVNHHTARDAAEHLVTMYRYHCTPQETPDNVTTH